MSKQKVISLGLSQSNFLIQLYGQIKKIEDLFSFNVDNLYDLSGGKTQDASFVFETFYNFSKLQFSRKQYFISFLKILNYSFFWKSLFFELNRDFSISTLITHTTSQTVYKTIVDRGIVPLKFSIFHFHYCIPYNLKLIHYLPKNANVLCSFWGSDLYRNKDKGTLFYVTLALKRANKVTIQTPEMGLDLLKRYGTWLEPKVNYALFALEQNIYTLMDGYKNDRVLLQAYKTALNIPLSHTVITIGYNANKAFNHIEILKALNSLPAKVINTITCILPLSYQRDTIYLEELNSYIAAINHFSIIKIETFIPNEEVAKLRLITDIQIQMPISDALSGSITEVLYAGNIVLAGDWLPYAIFERKGVYYTKIKNYEDLATVLPKTIKNVSKLKVNYKWNADNIKKHFFPQQTSKTWVKIYKNLIK